MVCYAIHFSSLSRCKGKDISPIFQFFQNNSPLFLQIFATESRYRITKTPLFTNCLFHFLSLQSHNLVEKTYTYTAYTEPEYQCRQCRCLKMLRKTLGTAKIQNYAVTVTISMV